jgi:RimJ/RimL family protein N-acetyltransferase
LKTERINLEPIGPKPAERANNAFMDSRDYLTHVMHWGETFQGGFSLEDEDQAMKGHWAELLRREAYAYTVLSSRDLNQCVGCLYLEPLKELGRAAPSACLTFWVIESERASGLLAHLLSNLLRWFGEEWPFERLTVPVFEENEEAVKAASDLALTRVKDRDELARVVFEWHRAG